MAVNVISASRLGLLPGSKRSSESFDGIHRSFWLESEVRVRMGRLAVTPRAREVAL